MLHVFNTCEINKGQRFQAMTVELVVIHICRERDKKKKKKNLKTQLPYLMNYAIKLKIDKMDL